MTAPQLTLLFDGECPLCVREVAFLKRRDRHGNLGWTDISAAGFDPAVHGLSQQAVMGSMHAVAADGSVIQGVEVFRRAYAAVGLGWLVAPTGWPLLAPLCDRAYALFARHRVGIGRLFGRPGCASGSCAVGRSDPATRRR